MSRADRRTAGAVFFSLAALYWLLRSPGFAAGDSPQHLLSALTWSVSRPPGYPLYVFLGWLASRLFPGDPAAAVSGLSGLFQAGASAFFFLLLRRSGCGPPAALAATALMSLSPLFWYYAMIPEVRALNNLLACACAYWLLAWSQERRRRQLWALGASLGLGLGHHPTFALLLPAGALWLWRARPRAREALVLAGAAGAAVAAPYLLLWARLQWGEPAYNPDGTRTLSDVVSLLLRRRTGGLLRMLPGEGLLGERGFDAGALLTHLSWFVRSLAADVTGVAALLAAGGAWGLRRRKAELAFWALWIAATLGPFLLLSSQQLIVLDPPYVQALAARYYPLPLIAVFALAGIGAEVLARRVRPAFIRGLALAAVAAPLALRPIDLRGHQPLLGYAQDILRASGPRDIVVLTADDTIFAMLCLQRAFGAAGERVFLNPMGFAYAPYARDLRRRHPDLVLPLGPEGLSEQWSRWLELNPERRLFIESTLGPGVAGPGLHPAPLGSLIELRREPLSRAELVRRAERFLEEDRLARLSRDQVLEFTQETYLLTTAGTQLRAYASALAPDGAPDDPLWRRLAARWADGRLP